MLSEDQRRFVEKVIDLYCALQKSYQALEDKSGIYPSFPIFLPFDSDLEEEYWRYCVETIEQQGRVIELDQELWRDRPRLAAFQRMIAAWEEMGRPETLSKEQVRELESAESPPRYRSTIWEKLLSFFDQDWRQLFAGSAGFIIGSAILIISVWAYKEIGITTYIEYSEPKLVSRGDVDFEVNGYVSPLGLSSVLIALIIGRAIYEVINEGSLILINRLDYQSVIAGSVFYGVVGQIWFEIFYDNKWGDFLVYILEIATAAIAFYLVKKWRDKKLEDQMGT